MAAETEPSQVTQSLHDYQEQRACKGGVGVGGGERESSGNAGNQSIPAQGSCSLSLSPASALAKPTAVGTFPLRQAQHQGLHGRHLT